MLPHVDVVCQKKIFYLFLTLINLLEIHLLERDKLLQYYPISNTFESV